MESIRIDSGLRIAINDDPARVITFDPNDMLFIEKFYRLYGELQRMRDEYQAKAVQITENMEKDENGVPIDTGPMFALANESFQELRQQIDHVFGEGTSQTAFGDRSNWNAFIQFFEGVIKYIAPEREKAMKDYLPPKDKAGANAIDQMLQMAQEYRQGKTIPELASKYHVKQAVITAALKKLGVLEK